MIPGTASYQMAEHPAAQLLSMTGVCELRGIAPSRDLERRIQAWVDDHAL